jgi:hypothetical protein
MSNGQGVYLGQKAEGHVELAEVWKIELEEKYESFREVREEDRTMK